MVDVLDITEKIREANIPTEFDLLNRKLRKNLEVANLRKIPIVLIMGKNDFEENKITIKEMKTGNQVRVGISEVINTIEKILN